MTERHERTEILLAQGRHQNPKFTHMQQRITSQISQRSKIQ